MNATLPAPTLTSSLSQTRFPLLDLLHPRRFGRSALLALAVGLAAGSGLVLLVGLERWMGTALAILVLTPVAVGKFREDRRLFGATAMLLSVLLTVQGGHTVEHIVQWAQYYLLGWPMRQANGLLSAANAEWVHFVWNWGVLLAVIGLMRGGMRNGWAWLLLGVAVGHTIEHSYLLVRHYQVLAELRQMGVAGVTAQGLPGILGQDGWLARSPLTRNSFLCRAPGLTTANRIDIHFWWNVLEMGMLLPAGHVFLKRNH
ncbi:MAG: hypothetical protein HY328_00070 [Chloroflexi bacterium]|nr:hypothetical protein [Chloroflexota bacterium]